MIMQTIQLQREQLKEIGIFSSLECLFLHIEALWVIMLTKNTALPAEASQSLLLAKNCRLAFPKPTTVMGVSATVKCLLQ